MYWLLDSTNSDLAVLLSWITSRGFAPIFSDPLLSFQQSRSFEQFTLIMPPTIRVIFYYFFDVKLWLYGLMALLGSFSFLVSLFKLARLSKENVDVPRAKTSSLWWPRFSHHSASLNTRPNPKIEEENIGATHQQL